MVQPEEHKNQKDDDFKHYTVHVESNIQHNQAVEYRLEQKAKRKIILN